MAITIPTDDVDLLVFVLADMRLALELASVREVARSVLITPLPEAPLVVEGIIDVRGAIVPVYDLRLRFGLPARQLNIDDRIVVAWTGDRLVALRAETADTMQGVLPASIEAAEPIHDESRQITGVARTQDGLVLIQDLKGFLDQAETVLLDDALSSFGRTS